MSTVQCRIEEDTDEKYEVEISVPIEDNISKGFRRIITDLVNSKVQFKLVINENASVFEVFLMSMNSMLHLKSAYYWRDFKRINLKNVLTINVKQPIKLNKKWVKLCTLQFESYPVNTLYLKMSLIANFVEDGFCVNNPTNSVDSFLYGLFVESLFCDVIVRSTEGIEHKAHKAILASRSDVLRAVFEHDTFESASNIVESPFESEIVSKVLLFIYTDDVPELDEFAGNMLVAADYYQLHKLKCLCEEVLCQKLNTWNAMEFILLAHMHGANKLKHYILEFMKHVPSKSLFKSQAYKDLKSVELIKEILEYVQGNGIDLIVDEISVMMKDDQ